MLTKKLKAFGKEHNWYKTTGAVFGLYKDYSFSIYQSDLSSSPQTKTIVATFDNITEAQQQDLTVFLKENKKAYSYKHFEVGQDYLSIVFIENLRRVKNEKLNQLLEFIVEELQRIDVPKINDPASLGYYNLSGKGVLLTPSEYEKIKQDATRQQSKDKLERTSYIQGFFGAFLFTIPVIILWVIVAFYFNYLIAALAIFIAIAASFGYNKFKGKLGVGTKWSIALATILGIFVANIITMILELNYLELDLGQRLQLIFSNEEVRSIFLQNLGMSMVFGALGIWWIVSSVETKPFYIEHAEKL